jgi:hypothetical protein
MHRGESRFAFLDRVAQPYWERIRALLEEWLSHYPEGHDRHDLIQRLRSPDDDKQAAAFWELYLHEILCRNGWAITPHPTLDGTSRQLDYLARRGADAIMLEATTIGRNKQAIAAEKRVQQVLADLDGLVAPDFYVSVDYDAIGPAAPSTKRLRSDLTAWLTGLDAAAVRSADAGGWETWSVTVSEPGPGWHLTFRALPVREGVQRAPGSRAIGMEGPGEAVMVDHREPLLRRLDEKAGAYGSPPFPYVIAVLDLCEYPPDEDDHGSTLYGRTAAWLDTITHREHSPFRQTDGFWSRPGRASAGYVAGVVTTWGLRPWTVATDTPLLWQSPLTSHALPALPWPTRSLAPDRLEVLSGVADFDPRALFGLGPEWPGPERAFEDEAPRSR